MSCLTADLWVPGNGQRITDPIQNDDGTPALSLTVTAHVAVDDSTDDQDIIGADVKTLLLVEGATIGRPGDQRRVYSAVLTHAVQAAVTALIVGNYYWVYTTATNYRSDAIRILYDTKPAADTQA